MEDLVSLLVPIVICGVAPIMIVWLVSRISNLSTAKKTEVLIKAIENGVEVDTNLLMGAARKPRSPKTIKQRQLAYLLTGMIFSLWGIAASCLFLFTAAGSWVIYVGLGCLSVGTAFIVAFFVGNRFLAPEIAAEERQAANAAEQSGIQEKQAQTE